MATVELPELVVRWLFRFLFPLTEVLLVVVAVESAVVAVVVAASQLLLLVPG